MNMKKNLFICLLLVQYLPLAAQYKYEETVTYPAAPGMKAVYHDGHWELQDRQGRKILPYNLAEDPPQFRDGITQIARYVGDHRVRFGFIDTQGREVIPPDLTYVYYWQDDRIVADKDHMGVMDFSGKTIIPFIYEYVIPPMGNTVAVQRKSDRKWGFLDIRTGRQLKAFVYDEVYERSYNAQKGTVEVEQGDETYDIILRNNLVKTLCALFGVEDLETANLREKAGSYLNSIGLTEKQLDALKMKLGV